MLDKYSSESLFRRQSKKIELDSRTYRYSLCITMRCNLACTYCYVHKNPARMSPATARQAIEYIFQHTPLKDKIEIGFFGGEPLLEFSILRDIITLIENHPDYDPSRVSFTLTTNGTIFTDTIASFLKDHVFKVCISCDGPPSVQNLFRRTSRGKTTAIIVERTIREAKHILPMLLVNAVYRPETVRTIPQTIEYFSDLGLRRIFLNADYTATWTPSDVEALTEVYESISKRYIAWYLENDPHFISLVDTKIAVLLRGGYHPLERCQMGTGELAITPDGGLYPCERLIGSGSEEQFRIGSLDRGIDLSRLAAHCAHGSHLNPECLECSLKECCMNWCGCSNIFMTGYTNRVGAFLCASERAAIQAALHIFTVLEHRLGPVFLHHLSGQPQLNSLQTQKGDIA